MSGRQLAGNERKETASKVYQMRVKRATFREIAKKLKIGRELASNLYREELDRLAADREHVDDYMLSLSTYESTMRAAWSRFNDTEAKSLNSGCLLNVVVACQEQTDTIAAVERAVPLPEEGGGRMLAPQ
jgi:hypothetical protein